MQCMIIVSHRFPPASRPHATHRMGGGRRGSSAISPHRTRVTGEVSEAAERTSPFARCDVSLVRRRCLRVRTHARVIILTRMITGAGPLGRQEAEGSGPPHVSGIGPLRSSSLV